MPFKRRKLPASVFRMFISFLAAFKKEIEVSPLLAAGDSLKSITIACRTGWRIPLGKKLGQSIGKNHRHRRHGAFLCLLGRKLLSSIIKKPKEKRGRAEYKNPHPRLARKKAQRLLHSEYSGCLVSSVPCARPAQQH